MATRIVSGIIAGILVFAAIAAGPYWITGLLSLMAIVGMYEWYRLNQMERIDSLQMIGYIFLVFFTLPWSEWGMGSFWRPEVEIWLAMMILLSFTVFSQNRIPYTQIATTLLGLIYVGFGFHFMVKTIWSENHGIFWAILIFVLTWASDSGAYFIGKFLGRRKLIPAISPNKTIEGSIGGVLIAVFAGVLFAIARPELLSIPTVIELAIVVSIFGQIGDLIQSAYKRISGIKDSGQIMPGHGGVLDRTDSWLIVFPIVYLLQILPL